MAEHGNGPEGTTEKSARWRAVVQGALNGTLKHGMRTPVRGVPPWVTLEVATGGFATGNLPAGGPVQDHERALSAGIPPFPEGGERRALNAFFLASPHRLADTIREGLYRISVPEEAGLPVVSMLVETGRTEEAEAVVREISPWFSRLRFFPVPDTQPEPLDGRVNLRTAGQVVESLGRIGPALRVKAQREAVQVWAPFYDRMVSLFLETVEEGWPCRRYPSRWAHDARLVLEEYDRLRSVHRLCRRPERPGSHFRLLRTLLEKCCRDPKSLSGREVGLIRHILDGYTRKRGSPESPECRENRRRQRQDVEAPMFHSIAELLMTRLRGFPEDRGLDRIDLVNRDVSPEEESTTGIPAGTRVPGCMRRKVERCLNDTAHRLVERGVITSGDSLAEVLPMMTSALCAGSFEDPHLGRLYGLVYRAFRRRRSLLLLNLQNQVQLEELPWVSALEGVRRDNQSIREKAGHALEDMVILTLRSFPRAIVPNRLLRELEALAAWAGMDIPLVDELAADIFTGRFSPKFLASARITGEFTEGTLYSAYYRIDWEEVADLKDPDAFAGLCASRAGVSSGTFNPGVNGMIIEQQQILTTQNLAVLFKLLNLGKTLSPSLEDMARECFIWICRRQQMKGGPWHARMKMIKNTAYAWRQMVFYLSMMEKQRTEVFIAWADYYLQSFPEGFRKRFRPALAGLAEASGCPVCRDVPGRLFLGWTHTVHWLLEW